MHFQDALKIDSAEHKFSRVVYVCAVRRRVGVVDKQPTPNTDTAIIRYLFCCVHSTISTNHKYITYYNILYNIFYSKLTYYVYYFKFNNYYRSMSGQINRPPWGLYEKYCTFVYLCIEPHGLLYNSIPTPIFSFSISSK